MSKTIKIRVKKIEKKGEGYEKKTRKLKIRDVPPEVIQHSPKKERINEKIIGLLTELSNLMAKAGDPMRARVYKKASETVMSFTTDITDPEQIKGKPGIGPTILSKVKEYLETGTLRILERERAKPENVLSDVYGIGPKKAIELVGKGITSIAELRARQDEVLNKVQLVGLTYYEDILEKIPRSEIDDYHKIFEKAFMGDDAFDKYEIVGSYRRGATSSGDIDVIITSKKPETFVKFIDSMIKSGIIVEVLSRGSSKCLVITKIPSYERARRVDFLYTSPEEYPFSVLYFTGSKAFNTVMRGHALKLGFSLNEHEMSDKNTKKKVSHVFQTEKDIFDFLGLVYKEPPERIDGRSVETSPHVDVGKPVAVSEKPASAVAVVEETGKTRKIRKLRKTKTEKNIKDMPVTEKKHVAVPEKPASAVAIVEGTEKTRKIRKPRKTKTEKNIKVNVDMNVMGESNLGNTDNFTSSKNSPSLPVTDLVRENLRLYKINGISVIEHLSEPELTSMLRYANNEYYNTAKPILTDNEYDIVKEYMQAKYPTNVVLQEVGAPITKNKVTLPYEMASMDKIKPDTQALGAWKRSFTGPYVLSCKLDGVSGMYSTEGDGAKLYTRGDGKIGQDITHLIQVLGLPKHKGVVVRGEFIIPKSVFNEKYKNKFANPRNLVAGIINSKTIDTKHKDLHFVAYEVIQPALKPSDQMSRLVELKHEVVQHKLVDQLTNENLSETLLDWRKSYEYEIDGVIVTQDAVYPRASGNPDHSFAFKMVMSDQVAEAKVVDVIWTPSKNGYLKPRVRIEPIALAGVTIEYATGFNGKFIEENRIGIGAIIQIIRSGDVIPYIKSITTPAERAKMPTVPYKWTDTHVDIVLESADEDETVRDKNITAFFVGLEVDGLSSGNVKRIVKAGFDTICKIIAMKKSDFENVEGFKEKLTEKIHTSIREKVDKATLLDIMAVSNRFGRGLAEKKMKPILEAYPDILTRTETADEKMRMLTSIKGIGTENAKGFVEGIPAFLAFLKECGLESKLKNRETPKVPVKNTFVTSHPLYQKKIVMTKVRDKEIIEALAKIGASLEDGIKKDTFALIVKTKEDASNKTKYAVEHGIPIFTPDEFKIAYFTQ